MSKSVIPAPWERQEKETPKQFEAFCEYRDMGAERSIRAVAVKLGKSDTLIGRWSSANNWVERVGKWDDEQERIEREIAQRERIKAIRKMRERQAKSGLAMQLKATEALRNIPVGEMDAQDITRMMVEGAKLERVALGDVGEVVEERDGGQAASPVTFYFPHNHRDSGSQEDEEE